MQTGRPTAYSTDGMVATPHYLATNVGLRVLESGGSAVDAAIAANAVLHLVLPHQCHIGGDLFAIVWDPDTESLSGLNASGPAPAAASVDQVQSLGFERMPERGELSVTVPGTVAGWTALHDCYGKHDFASLLGPAIEYAKQGVPITSKLAWAIEVHEWLLQRDDEAARTFRMRDKPRAGDVVRQPALAQTLERIASDGAAGFYQGDVAVDIVNRLRSGGSAMALDDLASFQPEWVDPLSVRYRDVELVELPANSQGPAVLLLAQIMDGSPVDGMLPDDPELVDFEFRAVERVFKDRDAYLSDPRCEGVDQERFLSGEYAKGLRESLADPVSERVAGVPGEDGDTAYLCVVDRNGQAVSFIQSVYMGFGSGVMAPESGVLFQNRGFSYSLDPDHVNALVGGKRPRHTLIPAMLMRDGKPWIIFGAMGGDGQAQTHLQLLHQLVDQSRSPQQAIEAPRWLRRVTPEGKLTLRVEASYGQEFMDALSSRGHNVDVGEYWDWMMGHAQVIKIDSERGVLAGGADPRGDGLALGI